MNTKNKKRIFLSPPHMSGEELRFVHEAFESNYIAPLGPQVDAFERDFAQTVGIPHVVALSSGTAAMHLALHILGIGQGDEVIASTLTFIGSITPVVFQGAELVFIDADRATWTMDPDLLEQELEVCKKHKKLPKAVVPTDLYGQCIDYERIMNICEYYNVPVVADAAEALGAKYQRPEAIDQKSGKVEGQWMHAGKGAKAAVFSFNGNKIITTSGGGMLASDDEEFIEKARFLSQQARDPFPYYEHSEIGYNYRMSNILAAIGRGQLKVLYDRVRKKREIYDFYQNTLKDLPGIEFMPEATYGQSNRWLTVLLITAKEFGANPEEVRLALEEENIEARPVWKPMHVQPVFRVEGPKAQGIRHKAREGKYRARVAGGEVSEDLFNRGLCLPSGTAMTEEDLARVVSVIRKCRK